MYLTNGEYYSGLFLNDYLHGNGEYTTMNGDVV